MPYRAALCAAVFAALVGCASEPVTVPDTTPPPVPPPKDAMQPCPTAETEGKGEGVLPDIDKPTEGAVIQAATTAARYVRTCRARHKTLRIWIKDYINNRRPPQDR